MQSITPRFSGQRVSAAQALGGALLLPAVVFLGTGNAVLFSNTADLPYRFAASLFFGVGFIASSATCFVVFRAAQGAGPGAAMVRICVGVALSLLLFDAVASLGMRAPRWFAEIMALDAAVACGVALAMRLLSLRVVVALAGVAGPLLTAQGFGVHALRVLRVHERATARRALAQAEAGTQRTTVGPATDAGNVYHLMFDGFQSEAYDVAIRSHPELRPDDFVFYPRFVTNYDFTIYAVPAMLTGRLYDPATSVVAWREEAIVGGLWAGLRAGGMRLHLYPFIPLFDSPLAHDLHPARAVTEAGGAARAHALLPDSTLIDLWFLHMLPRSARLVLNYGWDRVTRDRIVEGNQLHDWFSITRALRPAAGMRAAQIAQAHLGAISRAHMAGFLADETERPGRGQYAFIHIMLPHHPYVLDADCGYVGATRSGPFDQDDVDGYLGQTVCALRLLQTLVERLKALDRYEDALIVVHADHGAAPPVARKLAVRYPWAVEDRPGRATALTEGPQAATAGIRAWRNGANVMVRSRPVLLVKFPHARDAGVDLADSQLLDIAPTILRHAGLDASGWPGLPLQDIAAAPSRPIRFFTGQIPRNGPMTFLPYGGTLSEFVLEGEAWLYAGETVVQP